MSGSSNNSNNNNNTYKIIKTNHNDDDDDDDNLCKEKWWKEREQEKKVTKERKKKTEKETKKEMKIKPYLIIYYLWFGYIYHYIIYMLRIGYACTTCSLIACFWSDRFQSNSACHFGSINIYILYYNII